MMSIFYIYINPQVYNWKIQQTYLGAYILHDFLTICFPFVKTSTSDHEQEFSLNPYQLNAFDSSMFYATNYYNKLKCYL